MKKQIFVCVLVLIMCLFQSAMPVQVFAQEASIAQQVFDEHAAFLLRSDTRAVLLDAFTVLKDPAIQQLLTPETINLFLDDPDALKSIVPELNDDFIMLLKDDREIKAFFSDVDVQALLVESAAIDTLIALIHGSEIKEKIVIETTRRFTVKAGPRTGFNGINKLLWSRTFQFIGEVVEAKARWSGSFGGSPPGETPVQRIVTTHNRVIVSGILRNQIFRDSYLNVVLTIKYALDRKYLDINRDGIIGIKDLVVIASHFGESGDQAADVNRDGIVNILDLVLVAGVLDGDAAAPGVHAELLETLRVADVQKWLLQAQQLAPTDVPSQRGIAILKHLLATLASPKKTVLLANYPNPFNPETWIPYQLATPVDVSISIYAADGKLVRNLALGHQAAGVYETKSRAAYWDGRNAIGEPVASGVYFYTLTAGEFRATRKMLIVK